MAEQFPTLVNSLNRPSKAKESLNPNGLIPVRVIDISLSTDSNGESLFQVAGGWAGLGAIRFEQLNKGSIPKKYPQGNIAYPFDINFKKLPLIGEIVYITIGPSKESILEGNSDEVQFYYFNPISPWNSNHLNILPSPASGISKDTNVVDNNSVLDGIANNESGSLTEPIPGNTFEEKSNIRNLLPNEGDIIIEGRFGNSIRFGSTARQPSGSKNVESPWSTEGRNGNPITIIRNGQSQTDLPFNTWIPTYEDVQNDKSSIYMTNGQLIPVNLGSNNFASFGVDSTPVTNTTKLLQEIPVEDATLSSKELDDIENFYDTINQEPDLNNEIVAKAEQEEQNFPQEFFKKPKPSSVRTPGRVQQPSTPTNRGEFTYRDNDGNESDA
tara:strand:- start:7321 stop:8472 length:1152 start_codon:yes stop_codon:yes gene_type:complete